MIQENNNARRIYDIEAAVHKPVNNGFRVKVSIIDFGLYINGMMVFAPNDEHAEWSVFTPAQRAGKGKYVRIVEFDMTQTLWQEIHSACVSAVEDYTSGEQASPSPLRKVDDVFEVDLDAPINLDVMPF